MKKLQLCLLVLPLLGIACSTDLDTQSAEQSLTKGTAGSNPGQGDYCNDPGFPCATGEGDCDTDAQCEPGNICGLNNGANFGFSSVHDVCVPATCEDRIQNGTETSVDCGGDCGDTCVTACDDLPNGNRDFCTTGCPCSAGEGDCDSSAECVGGTTCGVNNGPQFGFGPGTDTCVANHCLNNVLDTAQGETQIDCGGPCGDTCAAITCDLPNGDGKKCTTDCQCDAGEGDCDTNADCSAGLTCASNNGDNFGFAGHLDFCVPNHCTNRFYEPGLGETQTDCGGPCGDICPAPRLLFSEYVEGTANNKALEIANEDGIDATCSINIYVNGSATVSQTIALGSVPAGEITVVCHPSASAELLAFCDLTSTLLAFMGGDDAVELVCNGQTSDVIGQIGFDPGTSWGSGNTTTLNDTIRRKPGITIGDTNGSNPFDPTATWTGHPVNTFGNLGTRNF